MEIHIKNLIVPIDKIKPNDFNPKPDYKSTEELQAEFERIKNSVRYHGQVDPIIVRELDDGTYEIINGYHRWVAMKELGFKEAEIKNLGKISRNKAIKIALSLEETKIPLDVIEVAELVKNLKEIGDIEGLPYSKDEIDMKVELLDFDFSQFEKSDSEEEEPDLVTLTFTVTREQEEIILKAINRIVEREGVSKGRALELICSDFLSSPYPNP